MRTRHRHRASWKDADTSERRPRHLRMRRDYSVRQDRTALVSVSSRAELCIKRRQASLLAVFLSTLSAHHLIPHIQHFPDSNPNSSKMVHFTSAILALAATITGAQAAFTTACTAP